MVANNVEMIYLVLVNIKLLGFLFMSIVLKEKFCEIIGSRKEKPTIALVAAEDEDALLSISTVRKEGVANALLIGNKSKLKDILLAIDDDIKNYEVIDENDPINCIEKAIDTIKSGSSNVLMKGLIDSSVLLKSVLKRDSGLRSSAFISHIALMSLLDEDKLYFVTDGGVNILPNLEAKVNIIENVIKVAHSLGFDNPHIACLCAKEKVSEKMIATVDAANLKKMNQEGIIKNCLISGPLALDNIVSKEAAITKGITDPVAGDADIILAPNIEVGNSLLKTMTFMAKAEGAGIVVGANIPIIFPSRADNYETKMNGIYMALSVS